MKNLKRLLSLFTVFAMIISLVPTVSYAGLVSGADKAKIQAFIMQPDASEACGYKKISIDDLTYTANESFYIGFYAKDFKNIEDTQSPKYVQTTTGTDGSGGLTDFAVGIVYNSTYVNFEPDHSSIFGADGDAVVADWKTRMASAKTAGTSILNKPAMGVSYNYAADVAAPSGDALASVDSTAGYDNAFLISLKPSVNNIRVPYSGADDAWLGFVKFTFTAAAAAQPRPQGEKVIGFSHYQSHNSMRFGMQGKSDGVLYQYYQNGAVSGNTQDYDAVIEFDETNIDILPAMHTVTFMNDTTQVSTETVPNNGTVASTKIPDGTTLTPPVAGQVFDDWYYDPAGSNTFAAATTKFDSTVAITADTTVFAKFKDPYKITFNSNYASTTANPMPQETTKVVNVAPVPSPGATMNPADQPTASDFPAPAGYKFKEWQDSATNNVIDLNTYLFTGDMTLNAIWDNKIAITFDENFGAGSATDEIEVDTNNHIPAASVPKSKYEAKHSDYEIVGWNTAANGSGTTVDPTTANITTSQTLYAQWQAKSTTQPQVTLTFDAVGGQLNNPTSITVKSGDTIPASWMPADPTKTAAAAPNNPYTFNGWYKTNAVTPPAADKYDFTNGYTLNADETAYANWSYNHSDKVTITFDKNGGDTDASPTSVDIGPGDKVNVLPAAPTKAGSVFNKWHDAATGGTEVDWANTTFSANTTVYANWAANITIQYNGNGATANVPQATTQPATATYTDPSITGMTNSDYQFIGWNTKQNGSGAYVSSPSGALTFGDVSALDNNNTTVTLYAQWAAVPPGQEPPVQSDTPATPNPANKGVIVTFDDNVDASSTHPVASPSAPKHKYPKYDDSIGTANMPNEPTRVQLPGENVAPYVFASWNTKPDGSGTPVDGNTNIGANLGDDLKQIAGTNTSYELKLYAQWELDPNYTGPKVTVTFNHNDDGKGADSINIPAPKQIVQGDTLGYDIATPVHAGADHAKMEFKGWFEQDASATAANGNGRIAFDTSKPYSKTTPITANTTFYAQWYGELLVVPEATSAPYTGSQIKPTYTIKQVDSSTNPTNPTDVTGGYNKTNQDLSDVTNGPIYVEYTPVVAGGTATTTLQNVGNYTVRAAFSTNSPLEIMGYEIAGTNPNGMIVTPTVFDIKVDPDTQLQDSASIAPIGITDTLPSGVSAASVYKVNYRKWTDDATADGNIQSDHSTTTGAELGVASTTTPTDTAFYAVEIEIIDSNYKLGTVTSSSQTKQVITYPATKNNDYPGYAFSSAAAATGLNIVYQISQKFDIKVKPSEQVQKFGQSAPLNIQDTLPAGVTASDVYDVVYKQGTVANGAFTPSNTTTTITNSSAIAYYVVEIQPKSPLYKLNAVVSQDSDAVNFYSATSVPSYTPSGSSLGKNILYQIEANDPGLDGVSLIGNTVIRPTMAPGATTAPAPIATQVPLDLKDSNYATPKPFSTADPDPTNNPNQDVYYVRVDKDTTSIDFTIDPKFDTTTATATAGKTGTTASPVTPAPAWNNTTKVFTVNVPITESGQDTTTITVTMTAADGTTTRDYTFIVQKLVEGKIELAYGNSPFGEIMRDPAITDKTAAKNAFMTGNKYVAQYLPANCNSATYPYSALEFTTAAWGDSTDPKVNMDRNDYAIFTYNKNEFTDTGFTATDSLGNNVADANITRTITVQRMSSDDIAIVANKTFTADPITIPGSNGNHITQITSPTKNSIVPDVYTMTYSFTDPQTQETVSEYRPIVVVWDLGDADLSAIVNPSDVTSLYSLIRNKIDVSNNTPAVKNLYTYRIADADLSAIVNPSDVTGLYSIIRSKMPSKIYHQLN